VSGNTVIPFGNLIAKAAVRRLNHEYRSRRGSRVRIIHERARGNRAGAGGVGPVEPFPSRKMTTQESRVGTAQRVTGTESASIGRTHSPGPPPRHPPAARWSVRGKCALDAALAVRYGTRTIPDGGLYA